ncbi:MAG TPA: MFS transporter [Bacteroidia bacterium]|nr:MFS transporter [Bacteroidia bacterium]
MSLFKGESLQMFRNKDFRLFICARFFLTLAIQMQFSTIYLQVYYEYTREEFMLGMIGLSEAVPFILVSLFSGHYADHHRKRNIILIGTILLMSGALFLLLNASSQIMLLRSLGLSALFFVVFVFGIIRSFLAASSNPFLSQLIPRKEYAHAATWNSTAWHLACILGPVIAGLVYGYRGHYNAAPCHFLELLSFLLAFVFLLQIRNKGLPQKHEHEENIFQSMRVGLRFVYRSKMLLSAISLDLFAVLFGGAVALIPAFTDKILGLGPEAYGLLRTAPAIGAVLMALILVFYPPGHRAGKALLWSVTAFGLFTILFALSTNYWLAFLMLFCTGAFDNVSVVVRHSILQLMTPDHMRGRVSAINSIFIGSSNEIGAFESGVAARLMGLVPSIVFGGAMTIMVVLGVHKLNPDLKKLDISKL